MRKYSIGVIGLGKMGQGIALNLLRKNPALLVFDQSAEATEQLVANGASNAISPGQLATQCEVVVLSLPSADAVSNVLFGVNSVNSAATQKKGLLILDTSTLLQKEAETIAAKAASYGIDYCDCPVSGLPKRANDGTLSAMVGASDNNFTQAKAILQQFCTSVLHCGVVGTGQAMKSVNNIIYNINIAALCEVLPVAIAHGLSPALLSNIVCSGSSRSFAAEHFIPKILDGNFEGDYSLSNAHKDIENFQHVAQSANTDTPLADAMIAYYEAAISAGHGHCSKSAMIMLKELELGVRMRQTDD